MLKFLFVLTLMLPSFAYGYECNEEIDQLSKQYEVKILCKGKSIVDYKMDFSFVEAEQEMIDDATRAVKSFLSSYEKNFLKARINSINLFKDIEFLDSPVGGINHKGHIWLTLDSFSKQRIDKIYQGILHHEFSSNIYKFVDLDLRTQWKNINSIYEYSISFLKKCLKDIKFCNSSSEKLFTDGFLTNYSLTDDENDFNVYAEILFTESPYIKDLAQKYPKIKNKLQKLKDVYIKAGFKGKFPDET